LLDLTQVTALAVERLNENVDALIENTRIFVGKKYKSEKKEAAHPWPKV